MTGKVIQKSSENSYLKRLKSLLKTELAIVYLTSDGSKFLDEYIAVIHESGSQEIIEKDRRWKQMKTNIAELVSKILKEKQWGIFFKNEPVQALPVQDSTTLYKVNEVKGDELTDAIEYAIEREIEWRNHQAEKEQNQTTKESLSGTKQTLSNTEE